MLELHLLSCAYYYITIRFNSYSTPSYSAQKSTNTKLFMSVSDSKQAISLTRKILQSSPKIIQKSTLIPSSKLRALIDLTFLRSRRDHLIYMRIQSLLLRCSILKSIDNNSIQFQRIHIGKYADLTLSCNSYLLSLRKQKRPDS